MKKRRFKHLSWTDRLKIETMLRISATNRKSLTKSAFT